MHDSHGGARASAPLALVLLALLALAVTASCSSSSPPPPGQEGTSSSPLASSGAPCFVGGSCAGGICFAGPPGRPGICTTACLSTLNCIPGWQCLPYGPTPACLCYPTPEVCDGIDNDCDGIIDNPIPSNAFCGARFLPGSVCAAGTCVCPPGNVACAGACADLAASASNCGACGTTCGPGLSCVAGACVCAPPGAMCGGTCIDTQTDPADCGGCGHACTGGTQCIAGVCACPSGTTSCGGSCIDTTNDAANCGACGHACAAGTPCTAGACACPSGTTSCGGACVNTSSDVANCGGCGTTCTTLAAGVPATCSFGACVTPLASVNAPEGLAVEGGAAFYLEPGNGLVKSVPVAGGAVRIVATSDAGSCGFSVSTSWGFWVTPDGSVWRAALAGTSGQPLFVFSISDAVAAAGNDQDMFAVGGSLVVAGPLGGTPLVTLSSTQGDAVDAVVVGSDAFWMDTAAGTVLEAPLGGGPIATYATGLTQPSDLTPTSAGFFVASADGGGSVSFFGPTGGAPRAVAVNQGTVGGVAGDGSRVYWGTGTGIVMTSDASSGPAAVLAEVGEPVTSMAVDASYAYIATATRLLRVAR